MWMSEENFRHYPSCFFGAEPLPVRLGKPASEPQGSVSLSVCLVSLSLPPGLGLQECAITPSCGFFVIVFNMNSGDRTRASCLEGKHFSWAIYPAPYCVIFNILRSWELPRFPLKDTERQVLCFHKKKVLIELGCKPWTLETQTKWETSLTSKPCSQVPPYRNRAGGLQNSVGRTVWNSFKSFLILIKLKISKASPSVLTIGLHLLLSVQARQQ